MFKKSILFFCLLSGFVALSTSACRKKSDSQSDQVTLRWVTDNNPMRNEQIARFEKANLGTKVNMDWSSRGLEKILVQIAGNDPPDIFDVYTPENMKVFIEKKGLRDLSEMCKRDGVNLQEIWPLSREVCTSDGKIYAIPTNASTWVLYYNKKLFKEAGIPFPDSSWTWDDFLSAAKKLTNVSQGKDYAKQCFGTGVEFLDIFLPWQYGASFYSSDQKKCICDSHSYKKAIRFIYDLRYKHHVAPTSSELQSGGSSVSGWGGGDQNLFAGGKLAMFFRGRWAVITLRQIKGLEYGIAPIPFPKEGKRVTLYTGRVTVIPASSRHPEEAFKFLKYLLTKDYLETITHGGDGIPCVMSLAKSDFFLKDPDYPKETNNQIYLDAFKYARSREISGYFDHFQVEKIKSEEMEKVFIGEQSPEAGLENIARKVNGMGLKK